MELEIENENPENSVESQSNEILQNEILQLNNKLLYQTAEFENYKKRQAKLLQDTKIQVKKDTIMSLISVFDDIVRSLKVEPSKGMSLVLKNFINNTSKIGLIKMDTLNQKFDSSLHEAIATKATEVNECIDSGIILEEIESGWLLDGVVIKFAKVVVSI